MTRFKPPRPRAALAFAAVTMATLTIALLVGLPSIVGAQGPTWTLLREASATAASSWAEAAPNRNLAPTPAASGSDQRSRPECRVHA